MLSPRQQIERYHAISVMSAEMVEAASSNEWSRLAVLEAGVASLRDELLTGGDSSAGLSVSDIELKRGLIERILADGVEIRRHADPWLEHVRQLLDAQTASLTQHEIAAAELMSGNI